MIRKLLPIAVLTILAGAELCLFLNKGVLFWDEAIYAQVAKEIIQRGQWLTLHWNGHLWFHKPPIYFWITALLFKLFGVSEFWARIVSALSGVGVVLLSYDLARIIYGRLAGFLTGIILLSSPLFVVYARFGTTDLCLTFFVTLAIYSYLRAESDHRYWIVAWTACAAAVMVKGAAGLVAPGALILALCVEREVRSELFRRPFWIGLLIAVVIVGSWHAALYLRHGEEFIRDYLFRHVLQRSSSDLNRYNFGYSYYIWVLFEFFSPWVCLVPVAIVFERRRKGTFVLIGLSAIVLCIYTIARTKFQWYILPALPPLAILVAGFLSVHVVRLRPMMRKLTYAAITLLFFAGLWRTYPHCLPQPEMMSAARLAQLASDDNGSITTCPEDLQMTVLFYSGRTLCAHPDLSPLAYDVSTKCESSEPRSIIFRKDSRVRVESFYRIATKSEDGNLEYAIIEKTE